MHIWTYDEDREDDGFCFSCEQHISPRMWKEYNGEEVRTPLSKMLTHPNHSADRVEEIKEYVIRGLPDRGINEKVAARYNVRVGVDPTNGEILEHYYPYYDSKNNLVGWKKRVIDGKKFEVIHNGDFGKAQLFGQHLCGEPGKMLVITEGECDAMAAYQMFLQLGKSYRVVSLPNGANLKQFKQNLEWIQSWERVMICFDQDEKGQETAKKAIELLPVGVGRLMSFSEKDANDMLLKNKAKEFYKALANAAQSKPPGIISGGDTWDRLMNRPKVESLPYPEDWVQMNAMTYGTRLGELDIYTSGTGMGKTQVMKELIYHTMKVSPDPVGVVFLEEPLEDTVESLMSLHLSKRIHLPDVAETVDEQEYREAWEATSGSGNIHYADAWGSMETGNLLGKIRYLARGLGCKRIYLDHLHIAISEYADDGDERARIDSLMSKLKALTRELNIWLGLVVHLRKSTGGGQSFEEGAVPTLDDLRGSASLKQLSNSVFALSRNQQHDDEDVRNTTALHVLKCRFTGRTGPAGFLKFDSETGRMNGCGEPETIEAFGKTA